MISPFGRGKNNKKKRSNGRYVESGWVWGEEGGQGMVCECLREALKEEENKGDAVTGEGNKKKAALH